MRAMCTNLTVFALSLFLSVSLWGQERTLSGTVTDASGQALIGANVSVKGGALGTITDVDGKYEIRVTDGVTLQFSYVGYTTKEVLVRGQETLNVVLSAGEQLDEVVVTALGISREKKALGYAVDEFNSETISNSGQNNVASVLQGRSPGVQVLNSSGAPGAGTNILIRGINSLNPGRSNRPLFVIDGIEVSDNVNVGTNLPNGAGFGLSTGNGTQTSTANRILDINPEDIASMSVLKGAAATALYGVRAANGAIIITTKKGQSGDPVVDVSYGVGWSEMNKSPRVQTQFIQGNRSNSIKRQGFLWDSWGAEVTDQTISEPSNIYEDFYQVGVSQQLNASVAAGNDRFTYRISGGVTDQNGITPGSYFNRKNFSINTEYDISKKFTIGTNLMYSNSNSNLPHEGRKSIQNVLYYMANVADVNNYETPYTYGGNEFAGIIDHPLFLAENVTNETNVNRLIGNAILDYQVLPKLKLRYTLGFDTYNDSRERIVHPETDEGQSAVNGPPFGFMTQNEISNIAMTSNLSAQYTTQLTRDLSLQATLGHYAYGYNTSSLGIVGRQFEIDGFFNLNNTLDLEQNNGDFRYRNAAFYGDLAFGYRDYLYLSLTGRNDWSSTLPSGNNSYFFPSASLSMVLSEAVDLPEVISFAKLRASYAVVGKDAGVYDVGNYYQLNAGFPFNNIIGYTSAVSSGSQNLRPEFTSTIELGADLRFWNNRIGVDVSYFSSSLDDMILSVPVPVSTGFARQVTNAGSLRQQGVEALLYADIFRSNDQGFNWTFGVNFGRNRTKVEEIATGNDNAEIVLANVRNVTNKYVVDGYVGDLYGNPFNRTDEGRLIVDDQGFPTLNLDTQVYMGNALPDFTMGFTNEFSYKGFNLSFLIEWKNGGKAIDVGRSYSIDNGQLEETNGRWQRVLFDGVKEVVDGEGQVIGYEENDIYAEINAINWYRNSSRARYAPEIALRPTDWVRLRNISLSYTLMGSQLNQDWFQKVRVSLIGNNLFLSTPYQGFDPESNFFGAQSNIYGYTGLRTPNTRSYQLQFNLTF